MIGRIRLVNEYLPRLTVELPPWIEPHYNPLHFMPRGDQVARFYALVMELAHSRLGVPAAMLAQRHGLPLRTVYRDLHALESAGFPLVQAPGAKWKLLDGWQDRVPFPLPRREALALHVARSVLAPLRGTPFSRDFTALAERLVGAAGTARDGQGELFPRFRAVLATRSSLAIDYSGHAAILETLCRGAETRTTLRVAYFTESRGEITRRDLDPYSLYYDPKLEALYLFAWCHLRKDVRTFAVHRFRQAAATGRSFQMPPSFSPESYLADAFRIWRERNAVIVRLRLDPELEWVAERRWHASQRLARRKAGGFDLELTVETTREIRRFILELGASVEVLEPAWLRREIAEEHAAAARRGRKEVARSLSPDDTARGEKRRRR